jgi:hypothetical protein
VYLASAAFSIKTSRRAKEAAAARAQAEHELQALALQLETAVLRAKECDARACQAEDTASKCKVGRCAGV